jgi:hypothetical protein
MPSRWSVAISSVALLSVGCGAFEDDRLGAGPFMTPPEADAIFYLAVRNEVLDAEVLWTAVHDDIRAATSRSQFIDCEYARAGVAGPTAPVSEQERPLEHPGEPRVGDVAANGAKVTSTNVLERDGITYSIVDRRDEHGVVSIDVQVEGDGETDVTTVQLSYGEDDPHWADPRYAPDGYPFLASFTVVGTVPEDPCLVGAASVRDRLQTTGTISIGGGPEDQLSLLDGYRVLAVVRDGAPDEAEVRGGAFWWIGEGPSDLEGVHPPNHDGAGIAGEVPADAEEPRHTPDWVDQAYLPTDVVRFEPGTYTIEVWADPTELSPSTRPDVPADVAERHCTMEVEVTAGPRTIVSLDDIPPDGGECPHETEFQYGF